MEDPVFEGYGRLIFPVDRTIPEDLTLADVGDILIWYHNVNPDKTVEIVNYMKNQVQSGNRFFMISIQKKRRQRIRRRKIQGCSFSGVSRRAHGHCKCRRRLCLCGGHA